MTPLGLCIAHTMWWKSWWNILFLDSNQSDWLLPPTSSLFRVSQYWSPSGPLESHGLKCQPFLLTLVPKSQHSSVSKFSLWQKLVVKTTSCYFFPPTNCITFGTLHNTTLFLSYSALSIASHNISCPLPKTENRGGKAPEMPILSSPRGS